MHLSSFSKQLKNRAIETQVTNKKIELPPPPATEGNRAGKHRKGGQVLAKIGSAPVIMNAPDKDPSLYFPDERIG